MSRLETLGPDTWKPFLEAPTAVLVLGKSDCDNCARWSEELERFLADDHEFEPVRFGKLLLDQRGLVDFKRAHAWVAGVDVLPFTVVFQRGEKVKEFAGGGVERLVNRLRRILSD